MNELRKDYLLDRWVIISEKRGNRPHEFKKEISAVEPVANCFFCPGNEASTPPEIGRIKDGDKWSVRWFANKFPAVDMNSVMELKTDGFFSVLGACGTHEVISETPDHSKQLADLEESHIASILKVYTERIKKLSKEKNVGYVLVFKNSGKDAGTSLIHTHTQIATVPVIPNEILAEVTAARKYKSKNKRCAYCDIIEAEKKAGARVIHDGENMFAFSPYASRFNYEAWIFPKKHLKSITNFGDAEYNECAAVLKKIIFKLRQMDASYNFFLHYAPKGKDLHFHIEITPRIAKWAGFELGSGIIINSVNPEAAAEYFRSP